MPSDGSTCLPVSGKETQAGSRRHTNQPQAGGPSSSPLAAIAPLAEPPSRRAAARGIALALVYVRPLVLVWRSPLTGRPEVQPSNARW